jgi:SAM-dependent methyltransferase
MTQQSSTHEYQMDAGYSGLAADMMDRMADSVSVEELDFYEARIRDSGGPALDLACGVGRHAVPLLERGLEITGVDASMDAIRLARARARAASVAAEFHVQTMQALDLPQRFATIYIPNGSYQVLAERSTAAQAVERFRRHLWPGGQLLIDMSPLVQGLDAYVRNLNPKTPWHWRAGARGDDAGELTSRTWVEQVSLFEQRVVEKREYQLIVDGLAVRTERHALNLRFYSKYEAELMLEAGGFKNIRWFANHGDRAPTDDSFTTIVCGATNPK